MHSKAHALDPDQFSQLMAAIGSALWQIQTFENTLAHFIVLILKLPPSRAEEEMRALVEQMDKKTLGGLIKELRKGNATNSVSEFERRMDRFLGERNWLVHKSWSQHYGDLYQPQLLRALFDRLRALRAEATDLNTYFGALAVKWALHQGITLEQIETDAQKFLREKGIGS